MKIKIAALWFYIKKSILTGFSCLDNAEEVRILFEQVPDFIFYDERCLGPLDEQNALRGKSSM